MFVSTGRPFNRAALASLLALAFAGASVQAQQLDNVYATYGVHNPPADSPCPGARDDTPGCVAFRHMHGVGTQNRTLSRLDGWPMRSPVNASPKPSRATAHDSGPMWIANPSS